MRPASFLLASALAAASPLAGAEATKPAAVHVPFVEGKPFAEVLRRAKAEGKPVMLDVVAAWCGPCKIMDKTTFADAGVVAWSKKSVVPARVDAEKGEGRKVSARYQAFSFPTVVFLDGDGNEIDRLVGAYQAADFQRGGEAVLGGKTPLLEGLAKLKAKWDHEEGIRLGGALALRRDRARLRPIALRVVSEEGELSRPEVFQLFAQLVAIETLDDDFSAETGDLIATFLPRLGTDPRRGFFAAAYITALGKRGDAATARSVAAETLAAVGEGGPYNADVLAALGGAEKKAGRTAEALAAFQRAADAAARNGAAPGVRVERQLDLVEANAAAGRPAEAKKAWASALELGAGAMDAGLSTRASRAALALKDPGEAVKQARRAVELTQGEDAPAQAALAQALRASGDAAGSSSAWKRAAELDPQNAEYRAGAETGAKKRAPKAS
ncbi:MAG TPA: thioredoxin fold domain-containing protein [Thermoanaerobaculia bacterium]